MSESKKPAILVFSTAYFPFVGGAEVAIREVAKLLSPKYDFFIITSRFKRSLPTTEKVVEGTIVRLGFGNTLDKYILPILGFFWAWRKPGILFGLDISIGSLVPAFLKFFFPKRFFILNIQYGYGDERLAKGRVGLIGMAFRFMLSQADTVTAISNYLLGTAKQYGYSGHSVVVPNGVNVENFQFLISNSQKKHPVIRQGVLSDDRVKIIITTSRLVWKNGIDILIKAVAIVKEKIPDVKCLILGNGSEEKLLKSLATQLNISSNIEFFGNIDQEKIPEYLASADIFVRPSRSEGLGISFLEAMAAGLPIIATPIGGIPDFLIDGETGLFCKSEDPKDLAEKILTLFKNKSLAKSIVENGQKIIKDKFLWDKISKKYEILFNFSPHPKILIATGIFPPDIGGPATYSKILLDELPNQGVGVKVLNFGSVRHLPKIIRHFAYGLRLMACGISCDIIFAQDPVSVGLPAALAAKFLQKKFLLKVVGDYAWEQWQQSSKGQGVRGKFVTPDDFQKKKFDFVTELRRKTQKFVARQAKLVIVPSNYLKKIVGMWGVDPSRIHVVYNSFEEPELGLSKEDAKRKLGISGNILISAGRNVPWKGFQTLRDLMPEISRRFLDTKLFIFHNEPKEKLFLYLRAADVFVLNTAYEGFSHQILEAMALGVPIITTNVGGNPEIVQDNETGFLVEFNDKEVLKKKIIELLENKKLAEIFSQKAQISIKRFTKNRMIDEIIDIIKTI